MAIQEWKGYDARHPKFYQPSLMTVDPRGNVYLLDQTNYRVLQFSSEGSFQKTWELPGEDGDLIPFMRGMAASDSFLYVSSSGSTYQFFEDGSVAQWNFGSCLGGLAVDRDGNLFASSPRGSQSLVVDFMKLRQDRERKPPMIKQRLDVLPEAERGGIWKLSSQGQILDHWDAPSWPITLAKDGTLYAVEPDSGGAFLRITKGTAELQAWRLNLDYTGLLRSVAVGSNGHLFVNDSRHVVEMDGKGNVLRRWCDPGPAYDLLDSPRGLSADAQGNLYVVDYFKSRVLKFDLNN